MGGPDNTYDPSMKMFSIIHKIYTRQDYHINFCVHMMHVSILCLSGWELLNLAEFPPFLDFPDCENTDYLISAMAMTPIKYGNDWKNLRRLVSKYEIFLPGKITELSFIFTTHSPMPDDK